MPKPVGMIHISGGEEFNHNYLNFNTIALIMIDICSYHVIHFLSYKIGDAAEWHKAGVVNPAVAIKDSNRDLESLETVRL